MQLPQILQGEDDEPKSIEEHVEIGIQNLDDQILAAEEELLMMAGLAIHRVRRW